jgi:predicted transcriptional regulator
MMTIAIRLDPEVRYKLEHLARITGKTRSSLVAEAVRLFVDAQMIALAAGAQGEESEDAAAGPERWNIIV